MTTQWILFGACAASALMATARAGGTMQVLGSAEKPFRNVFDRAGSDRADCRARARAIIDYLTARSSGEGMPDPMA